ncbi:MAG: DUF1501 domain-containing protein [Planctomycetia bacterium]|nr:DUF1501 domain-containing protein [Planctomycetia bacterium]
MDGTPKGLSRRDVLKLGLAGTAGLAMDPWRWLAAENPPGRKLAKSVIQIWMWGGPCHIDTFDPKPEAGRDTCGPLDKPVETNVKGMRICQLLPELAKQADKYSLVRSMTHGVNSHETASYIAQTGRKTGRLVFPSAGAVVSLFKGYDAGYKGSIPPYVVLTTLQGRFSESGFLGQRYKPFATGGDPNRNPFEVDGIVAQGITDERQVSRRKLLMALDTLGNAVPGEPALAQFDAAGKKAYEMMFGDVRKLFDLGQEKAEMRDRYGRNTFGQSCLMARRLVEEGVPYVTINYPGWDTHKQHFETMNRKLPEMDKAMAALLSDLHERGLLETTVVWWGGEFGRTPKVQWEAPWNGGRGHHGACYSALLAGGGFRGGQVVGEPTRDGLEVKDRPVYPRDLIAAVYERLGIDPEAKLPNPRGIDTRILPEKEEGADSGGRLKEIL